ncbi:MAG: hypothetical protein ACR2IE_11055 [Candidatus Sumerlaeaceae bacterium]
MSVILEALQKARVDDPAPGPAASRVVDVHPARGVKLRNETPRRLLWLVSSVMILMVVGGAGAAAFYWVMEHRNQFSFGLKPQPVSSGAAPTATLPVPRKSQPSELPQPVALQSAPPVALQSAPPLAAVPSQVALPPPPVAAATPAPAPATPFSLGTILCGEGNDCTAMVNGRTVHRGDQVKDHRVVEITSTEVRLQRGTETPVVLSLSR